VSSEELNDVQFQRILINRVFYLLSLNVPVRIHLNALVNACKTFEEFFMLWSRYKVKKQVAVDDLVAEGYTISPKVDLMASKELNANKPDKPPKTPKGVITNFGRAPKTPILLDPQFVSYYVRTFFSFIRKLYAYRMKERMVCRRQYPTRGISLPCLFEYSTGIIQLWTAI
jgi:hypothetical protein